MTENQLEKDRLLLTLSRIDHYYDSVNNKSAVYITINTFVTGGVIAILTNNANTLQNIWNFAEVTTSLCLLCGIGSLILLSFTSIPFFSTKPDSLIYFGSISTKTLKEFSKASKQNTVKENLKDLRAQVFILSGGLTKKFQKLKIVGYMLFVQFLLLLPLILFLIFNS